MRTVKRILLLHRDQSFHAAYRSVWERAGFEICSAYTCGEALASLEAEAPDLLVVCESALQDGQDVEGRDRLCDEARRLGLPVVTVSGFPRGLAEGIEEAMRDSDATNAESP